MPYTAGVILSGCGFRDGAEIHEAVLTLLALDRMGVKALCMAPDMPQAKVVNHLTGKETAESRNVLVESARICRGEIVNIATVKAGSFDALILPGGYGAALNLSDFAKNGARATVHPEVARLVRETHKAKKPVCAICIAPAVIAAVLGKAGPTLTIGNDEGTAAALAACGAGHETCGVRDFVVDRKHRIVTTPAWMLGPSIAHVAEGIEKAVRETVALIGT
ncbi:MAG: isoprenoid biosynthesis glyoxalase ElbB [Planctomycetes bacterium]|jgi:enhancing lycopene biosynthesis protein 2|nr:isoprenoid biosynthesis glyoxalase ElbB [Planctomycetota bacterium]MCL4731421.1 isoprenoid biosynthesis glyoxalase ElbB [Planctomycetota bacterium]